jgi:hypothetical protein
VALLGLILHSVFKNGLHVRFLEGAPSLGDQMQIALSEL